MLKNPCRVLLRWSAVAGLAAMLVTGAGSSDAGSTKLSPVGPAITTYNGKNSVRGQPPSPINSYSRIGNYRVGLNAGGFRGVEVSVGKAQDGHMSFVAVSVLHK